MKKVWNIVLTICAALLVVGVVSGLVALFTGGSYYRIIETVFGSWENYKMFFDLLLQELKGIFA